MFDIRDEGALPSLADLVRSRPETALDERAIAEYGRVLSASDLPLATTMSVAGDVRAMIERVLFRKLVRELPEENCSIPWFECHVPPGGSTVVCSGETSTKSGSLELKIFGSGVGRGRKVSITASNASAPRKSCATYLLDLRVKPRLFEIRGRESVELEITQYLGKSFVSCQRCPYCGVVSSTVDDSAFRFGEHLDLRNDQVTTTRKFRIEVEDAASIEASVKLASIPIDLKLGAKVSHSYSLEVQSEFPPGVLYEAYTRLGAGPLQTEMWATEGRN